MLINKSFSTLTKCIIEIFPNIVWFITFLFTIIGFKTNRLSHIPLSINYLHSHLHLSLFQRFLLLKTRASSLNLHLKISYYFMCLVSLVLDIRLNTLIFMFLTTSVRHNFLNMDH